MRIKKSEAELKRKLDFIISDEEEKNEKVKKMPGYKDAMEMMNGAATVIDYGDPTNPREIQKWIDGTIENEMDLEGEDFPNIKKYDARKIAEFFKFNKELIDSSKLQDLSKAINQIL